MAEEVEDIEREVPQASDAAGHISTGQSRVCMRQVVRSRTKRKETTTQRRTPLAKSLNTRQATARGQARAIYGNVYGDVHFASDGPSRNRRTSDSITRNALTPSLDRHLNIPGELRAQTVLVTLLFLKIFEEILKCLLGHAAALNRGQTTVEPLYAAADSALAFSRAGPWRGLIDGGLGGSPLVQTLAAVAHLYYRLVEVEHWPDIEPVNNVYQLFRKAETGWYRNTEISIVQMRSDTTKAFYAFAAGDMHPALLSYLLLWLLPSREEETEHSAEVMRSLIQTSCHCLPSAHPLRLLFSISERTDRIALFWHMVALSKNQLYVLLAEEDSFKHWGAFREQVEYAEIMSEMGDVLESSNRLHDLLQRPEVRNDQQHIADIYRALGVTKFRAALYHEALMFLKKALALYKKLEMAWSEEAMVTQFWLGAVSMNLEDWSAAESCYEFALQNCKSDDTYHKCSVRGLFTSLWYQGKYHEARKLQRRYSIYFKHQKLLADDDYSASEKETDSEESHCYWTASNNDYGSDEEDRQWEDYYSDTEIHGARRSCLNEAWDSIEKQTHVLEPLACPAARRRSI